MGTRDDPSLTARERAARPTWKPGLRPTTRSSPTA